MKDVEIIGMIKSYVKKTLVGMGALKGAPCQVQGVTDEGDGTQTLTLEWKDSDGVIHTTDITLPAAIFAVLNPTNGQTLRYNSVSGKFENSNVSFSANLDDLDDVVITSVRDGQVLTYDAANNQWINADGSVVAALDDLTDVTITTAQNGQILVYNSTANKWVNATLEVASADVDYTNTTSGLAASNVQDAIDELTSEKVDKETGKGLSENDYTDADKAIVDGVTSALADKVDKVTGKGLSENDYTDADKAIVGGVTTALADKVDKETGKGLSTNDFTDALKDKLNAIEANAEVNDIDTVKVNGTALTPDANKAVNIELAVNKLSDVDLTSLADGMILIYDAANNKWYAGANTGATYTAGEGIEIDQNNVISSKMVLFTGTEAQWNALPLADKIKFTHYATNDDQTGQIDPVPTQNSANLMTSGGIWTALQDKANTSDLGTAAAKDSTNAVTSGSSDLVESGAVDTAITSAIEALDVSDTAVAGSYVTEVSETDGKISVTREAADATPTASSNKMVKSGGVYSSEQDIYAYNGVMGAKNLIYVEDFTLIKSSARTKSLTTEDFGNDTPKTQVTLSFEVSDSNLTVNGEFRAYAPLVSGVRELLGGVPYMADGTYSFSFDATKLDQLYIFINNEDETTATCKIGNVMLRLASDTDSTYQPYAKTNKQLTDDKAEITQISNPNLLDNPWFTVNQRGANSYSNNQYSVDRWYSGNNNQVAVSNSGITLSQVDTSQSGVFYQIFEDITDNLNGKLVTISLLDGSGNLYTMSGTVVHNTVWTAIFSKTFNNAFDIQFTAQPIVSGVYRYSVDITTHANKTITFKAVKLELGSVSTLAMDTAPNYATELLKCQRYFMRIKNASQTATSYILGMALSTTDIRVAFPVPENMRSDPSIAVSNAGDFYYSRNNFSGAVAAASVLSAGPMLGNMKPLIVEGVSLTQSVPYIIYFGPNAYIDFSADI